MEKRHGRRITPYDQQLLAHQNFIGGDGTYPDFDAWYQALRYTQGPGAADVLLFLLDGTSTVNAERSMMDICTAMVIGERAQELDFTDKQALEAATQDLQMAITYVLGRVEATVGHVDQEKKHRPTMT